MSQEQRKVRRWTVQRKFEPNRLSQVILERAYTILVPPYTFVLRTPGDVVEELSGFHQQVKERCTR
jgi:hypothetical protein